MSDQAYTRTCYTSNAEIALGDCYWTISIAHIDGPPTEGPHILWAQELEYYCERCRPRKTLSSDLESCALCTHRFSEQELRWSWDFDYCRETRSDTAEVECFWILEVYCEQCPPQIEHPNLLQDWPLANSETSGTDKAN